MTEKVLLDTGPLVAWLCETDQWHGWVAEHFRAIKAPMLTCEAVLTEACFLYSREGGDPSRVVSKVRDGFLQIGVNLAKEAGSLETLMKRYSDTPMSLADACLVRLSELNRDCRVFTLDRHFSHYRRFGRSVIPLLSPW